jgi:hypothetical protein
MAIISGTRGPKKPKRMFSFYLSKTNCDGFFSLHIPYKIVFTGMPSIFSMTLTIFKIYLGQYDANHPIFFIYL